MSYLDKVRDRLSARAEKAIQSQSGVEWTPDVGSFRVRLLPPINDEDPFYYTHSFHYVPASIDDDGGKKDDADAPKAKYVYSKKHYKVGGSTVKDPFDTVVSEMYDEARKVGETTAEGEKLKKIAGRIKRKRHFYFQCILLDETDPDKKFRILKDTSNDGKLARVICSVMGVPFFRDFEDEWVEKGTSERDPDKEYKDLLDMDMGYDFKIIKKKTGNNTWDVSYAESCAIGKPRSLTDEEKELLEKRVNLKTIVQYEEDYNVVKRYLEEFLGEDSSESDEDSSERSRSESDRGTKEAIDKSKAKGKKVATKKEEVIEDDDEEIDLDALANDLPDDDE